MVKAIRWALILILSSYAVGQVAPANSTPPGHPKAAADSKSAKAAPEKVPADAAVITVPGVCKAPATAAGDCKTVITRARFDALLEAMAAGRPDGVAPEMRQNLGSQYGEMLVFAQEAERQGVDKDPNTQLLLRFARMETLARQMLLAIQKKSQPSPQEIQKYYAENAAKYQEIHVQRVMVPTYNAPEKQGAPDMQALKRLAEEMRKRLAAGEDPAKLQQEVYDKLGFKKPVSTASVLDAARLPRSQQSVTRLKAGEVSEVLNDPMAFMIYKSEGAQPVPLDKVKEDIREQLEQQKRVAAIEALMKNHQPLLNTTYFQAPSGPPMGMGGHGGGHKLPPHAMPEEAESPAPAAAPAPVAAPAAATPPQ